MLLHQHQYTVLLITMVQIPDFALVICGLCFYTFFMGFQYRSPPDEHFGIYQPGLPSTILDDKTHLYRLVVHSSGLMSANPTENLHTFEHLLLKIWTRDFRTWKCAVRRIEVKRLDGFPDAVDHGWREGYHCDMCQ